MVDINDYTQEGKCFYKNECYSVRDNGAVLRHPLEGKKARPTDNNWTFGKLNTNTGYLEIASVRIHRIVAHAFHGEPPTKEHVVDHIDTNKQNNRPDNLRWVTRLENVLLNPITARRIEMICGSVEAFLADPSKFRDKFPEPNYQWMCAVSKEEAQASKERLLTWAESERPLQGGTLGAWIFRRSVNNQVFNYAPQAIEYFPSLTSNAFQNPNNWRTPSEFPCCPQEPTNNPIIEYARNLKKGITFTRNQNGSSIIEDFAISNDEKNLWIMCRSAEITSFKPYSLAQVTYQNGVFVHSGLGTYFQKEGAEKRFILAQGLEWTGGDTFDDYC